MTKGNKIPMKIVHIAPNAPFNDGWGYQDNLLPKYHKQLGHTVTLFITTRTHKDGHIINTDGEDFVSQDGFRVVRLPYRQYPLRVLTSIFCRFDVFDYLIDLQPDLVFFHGVISATILDVIRYQKYRRKQGFDCRIIQDNHSDYNNSKQAETVMQKCLQVYYRLLNKYAAKYVEKYYGVTPWRKQYLEDYFRISPEKTDVLIMGADDEQVDFAHREEIRSRIRKTYDIEDKDFLVVTGGKIDSKKNIHLLMEACGNITGVKLLIFGEATKEFQETFETVLKKHPNISSVGWVDSGSVYDYFFAADLVCFPGGHSVLWEQACATKVPCLFARWPGMEHVNNGGNAKLLDNTDAESLRSTIEGLRFTPEYYQMLKIARSEATDVFLYSEIAKKSLK